MTESQEDCELLFDKMLKKLVSCKKISAIEFSMFLKTVVHDNNYEFLSFNKEYERLDLFLWKFTNMKTFNDLQQ